MIPTDENERVLRSLAREFKGRVAQCELYDANICTCRYEPDQLWKPIPVEGAPLSKRARFSYRERKIELFSNHTYFYIGIEGAFAISAFSINLKIRIGYRSVYASDIQTPHAMLPAFTQDGALSAIHKRVLDRPEFHALLDCAELQKGEGVVLSAGDIGVYLVKPGLGKVRSVVEKAIDLADAEQISDDESDLTQLPSKFHPLIPMIEKWAIADDLERQDLLDAASNAALKKLLAAVEPYLASIDSYLDSFIEPSVADAAAALGCLAETAAEIRQRLSRIGPSE
jgi:hypothetical protein